MQYYIKMTNGIVLIDPFHVANKHPKAEEWQEEALARIRLAEALYRERTTKGYTMLQLAKKAKTTPAVIARIEGAQVSAGIDLIAKIFKALGKSSLQLDFN